MAAETIVAKTGAGESRGSWTSHETPGAYEMRPCPGAPWTRLDEAALAAHLSETEVSGPDLAMLAIREGYNVWRDSAIQPTVAGYALFGVHPEALRPAWRVVVLRLAGKNRTAPVAERLDTEGPAPQAIAQVDAFLRRNLQLSSLGGQEAPEYPRTAALEAVANAVAHRDYAAPSQVFVRLFEDRLEVENPGGLLSGLTLEGLLASGESRPRNPVIAEALRRMRLMAPAGRGLAFMREEMDRLGSPPPEFTDDADSFRVTLRARRR